MMTAESAAESTSSQSVHSSAKSPLEIPAVAAQIDRLRDRLGKVLLGKQDAIELVIACLLSRGHLLLDDLPGTGKTTLAKAVAACIGGKMARVQCTPDLLPSDVTGFNLFNQKTREFEFHAGPVFSDVLLSDELNRTTPRTQSALLEAMAERQVTIDAVPYPLSKTFFVIATQNPIDSHGAYPLPEAQLDRFTIKLAIGYPDRASQLEILEAASRDHSQSESESSVLTLSELTQIQERVRTITVHPRVRAYLVDLVEATRNAPSIQLGVSPRGMLLWQRIAQAWAVINGRDFVTPSDIAHVARPVLSVRLLTTTDNVDGVIDRLLDTVPAPEYR
ncbi:AAA family ATPase [Neorhodopirellula lusitana]|uniref:AAA family ATPase n=1 Tax=Neorhodopirellula lusitana TaxID=445327 RepID=UPI003850617C